MTSDDPQSGAELNAKIAVASQAIGKKLYESGLLFEINRTILHPFGLALGVTVCDDGRVWLDKIQQVEDPGFVFGSELLAEGNEKFEKFVDDNQGRLDTRQQKLGYLVQPFPGESESRLPVNVVIQIPVGKKEE